MNERRIRMIRAFVDYEQRDPAMANLHATVGMPLGTRLLRMIRKPYGWWIWLSTADYEYGTLLVVFDNGRIERLTTRVDEGDEVILVRPSDEEIRSETQRYT